MKNKKEVNNILYDILKLTDTVRSEGSEVNALRPMFCKTYEHEGLSILFTNLTCFAIKGYPSIDGVEPYGREKYSDKSLKEIATSFISNVDTRLDMVGSNWNKVSANYTSVGTLPLLTFLSEVGAAIDKAEDDKYFGKEIVFEVSSDGIDVAPFVKGKHKEFVFKGIYIVKALQLAKLFGDKKVTFSYRKANTFSYCIKLETESTISIIAPIQPSGAMRVKKRRSK